MTLNNIKEMKRDRGFTIVELLIVIVIIAVLAAITIVAYNGITARAKTSSAQSAATAAMKKAEAYVVDGTTNKYPLLTTDLTAAANSGKTFYLTGVTLQTAAPTSASDPSVIMYRKCSATALAQSAIDATNITGARFYYFDYTNGNANSYIAAGNDAFCNP
jgi:prepilin-type N-terminal cleavage/methylation domain-containing protein